MATTSLANRSASVSSEPDATSDGYVGASLCWRYARISLVEAFLYVFLCTSRNARPADEAMLPRRAVRRCAPVHVRGPPPSEREARPDRAPADERVRPV